MCVQSLVQISMCLYSSCVCALCMSSIDDMVMMMMMANSFWNVNISYTFALQFFQHYECESDALHAAVVVFVCSCHFVANAVSVAAFAAFATSVYVEYAVARTIEKEMCGEKQKHRFFKYVKRTTNINPMHDANTNKCA